MSCRGEQTSGNAHPLCRASSRNLLRICAFARCRRFHVRRKSIRAQAYQASRKSRTTKVVNSKESDHGYSVRHQDSFAYGVGVEETDFMAHETTELEVTGMTCSNCARHVTEAIQGVAGVRSATVNLEQNKAVVRWADGDGQAVADVIGAVREAGFEAREIEDHNHDDHGY